MEKFEFEDERSLEIFSGFVARAKGAFSNLIDNIKGSIKEYEERIEETTKEIADNESSREKCEHEITKMESKIDSIKETIENVENTYKKIADAYSSTSKGETKELYSEIIDGAKANCEKDVLKNRSEIARLNSDIEAIKNNISEFTKIIEDLNRDLENYNLELFKYNKALDYMQKMSDRSNTDLEEISNRKEVAKKPDIKTAKRLEPKRANRKEEAYESPKYKDRKSNVMETLETETFETPAPKPEAPKSDDYEDSLKQIFDLTGYTPGKKEEAVSAPKSELAKPVVEEKKYTDNLENLFSAPMQEPVKQEEAVPFLDADFSNWENILNAPSQESATTTSKKEENSLVDQLLVPYGTTFNRLKSLTTTEITHKDGSKTPFVMTEEDVVHAINAMDGNDLKAMKTVGPEITLLRRVMSMKEGAR